MDDFLFLARTQAEAIWQCDYIERHLSGFGLLRNPNKGVWKPTQKLVHLGLEIDTSGSPTLRTPAEKLANIARAAKRLIQRAKRDRRWLPARELAALAGKCQFLYLAIAPARFYLREPHDVLKTRDSWSGRVKLTRQLERDLQWWVNRHIRLHEDNQAVVGVLTNLTSRSPRLMAELRKTWYLMDTHGITLSVRYIRSAANIWADRLSREIDCDDWQFNPRRFASLTAKWGACTIDRFTTSENALLPRYNARWRDPRCEAVDALRLSDAAWRCELTSRPPVLRYRVQAIRGKNSAKSDSRHRRLLHKVVGISYFNFHRACTAHRCKPRWEPRRLLQCSCAACIYTFTLSGDARHLQRNTSDDRPLTAADAQRLSDLYKAVAGPDGKAPLSWRPAYHTLVPTPSGKNIYFCFPCKTGSSRWKNWLIQPTFRKDKSKKINGGITDIWPDSRREQWLDVLAEPATLRLMWVRDP
eukprot:jgi/Tetstr1/440894/TSEL_029166.t1